MTQTDGELLAATRRLSKEVKVLSERLSAKEILYKRIRVFTALAVIIAIIGLASGGLAWYAIDQNSNDAKISCQNANESRQAQKNIWNFVYLSNESDPETDKQSRRLINELRAYTDRVFAERDCNDLSRKYPLPDPPVVPK